MNTNILEFLNIYVARDRVKSVQLSKRPQPYGLRTIPSTNRSMSRHEKKRYEEAIAKSKDRLIKKQEMAGRPPPGATLPPPVRSVRDMTGEEREAQLRQRRQKRDETLKNRAAYGPAPEIGSERPNTLRQKRSLSAPSAHHTMTGLERKRYEEALAKSKAQMEKKNQMIRGPRPGVPLPPPVRSVKDMTVQEREALRQRKLKRDEVLKKKGEEGIHKRFKTETGGTGNTDDYQCYLFNHINIFF